MTTISTDTTLSTNVENNVIAETQLKIRRCLVCQKSFYPKRSWQKFCSDECSEERNRQRSRKQAARLARERQELKATCVLDDTPEPMTPEYMDTEGIMRLCTALAEDAWIAGDKKFFTRPLGRMILDTVGVDSAEVIKMMTEKRYE